MSVRRSHLRLKMRQRIRSRSDYVSRILFRIANTDDRLFDFLRELSVLSSWAITNHNVIPRGAVRNCLGFAATRAAINGTVRSYC